jgi:hypothetical protein
MILPIADAGRVVADDGSTDNERLRPAGGQEGVVTE